MTSTLDHVRHIIQKANTVTRKNKLLPGLGYFYLTLRYPKAQEVLFKTQVYCNDCNPGIVGVRNLLDILLIVPHLVLPFWSVKSCALTSKVQKITMHSTWFDFRSIEGVVKCYVIALMFTL